VITPTNPMVGLDFQVLLCETALKNGQIRCGDYNANEVIEKAAEVFAAEFIYPAQEFLDCASSIGRERSPAPAMGIVLT